MKTTFKEIQELPMTLQATDIANALGLSRGGAYQLMKAEGFPSIKIGRRLIVSKAAFEDWLNQSAGKEIAV